MIDGAENGEPPSASKPATLYERIGGRETLTLLLRRFYADVRQHELIGPIFNRTIQDWPTHLEKIADFWSNMTGGPILYAGPMPYKHIALRLEPKHFEAWLDLWRRHCRAHIGGEDAEELIAAAETLGERIRLFIKQQNPDSLPE